MNTYAHVLPVLHQGLADTIDELGHGYACPDVSWAVPNQ
jgi:hypothetical protein